MTEKIPAEWTREPLPFTLISDIVFFQNVWLILGRKGTEFGLFASEDLRVWDRVPGDFHAYARIIAAGGRVFCFRHPYCGDAGAFADIMCSADGWSWTRLELGLDAAQAHYIQDVTFDRGVWSILGEALKGQSAFRHGVIFHSTDLKTWEGGSTADAFPACTVTSLCRGNAVTLALVQSARGQRGLMRSARLPEWEEVRLPQGFPGNLCWFNNSFHAFSSRLSINWHSQDGANWTKTESRLAAPQAQAGWPQCSAASLLVIRPGLGTNAAYASQDFCVWQELTLPFPLKTHAVARRGLVLVGADGDILSGEIF